MTRAHHHRKGGDGDDRGRFTHLTFDCYGTLIDWECGILSCVRPVLDRHGVSADDATVVRLYAEYEAGQEAGDYKLYRDVLRGVMAGIASRLGFTPTEADLDALPNPVGRWQPFPDPAEALRKLKTRYKLAVLSNVDDALFAQTAGLLGVEFDEVITSEQVGSYKPSRRNFRAALGRLGVTQEQVLHVAQSIYHDHVPARGLGIATVWVSRESVCAETGVAPPATASPDVMVPDLASLV
ncbi:MAG: haloacid dehalogenase type II, partial [Pyrinomonadaceae bacterium]